MGFALDSKHDKGGRPLSETAHFHSVKNDRFQLVGELPYPPVFYNPYITQIPSDDTSEITKTIKHINTINTSKGNK